MRVEKVFTNLTCNQNCTFCHIRRPSEDRSFIARPAVLARIDQALARGAKELIFTGGEPTLRRDLEALLAHARARGAERILLETNATLIDTERAEALRASGLDTARVHLSAFTEALDHLSRDPGGFDRAVQGARALIDAGVRTEISVSLVRSTRPYARDLPSRLAGALPGIAGIRITVPIESPDETELISYEEAAEAISVCEASARRIGIALRLEGADGPPPCVFPARAKVAHLFSMHKGAKRREGFRQVDACLDCELQDACSGFAERYLQRHPVPTMRPIREERLRRRLSMISSVETQIDREMVTLNHYREGPAESFEHIIRIHFQCNQTCRFCFVSTHLPAPDEAKVRDAIERAGREDARIVLSGGEPTLNPKLIDYVKLAKSVSQRPIELQTNAILLDDSSLVARLADAGIAQAFVSLHGSRAEISDAITGAPGTFARTLRGIDHLEASPITTTLNFVLCQGNYRDFVPFVRMALDRWPRAILNVSFVAPSTDLVPRDRALIPRYTDVLPELAQAVAIASARGRALVGFQSMCGIPLCLVPDSLKPYFDMSLIPEGSDGGEFVRAEACGGCALEGRCYGLRRGYAELYGGGELRTVVAGG